MPIVLLIAVLAVLFFSRKAQGAEGGYGTANQAPPKLGPSTGTAAQWVPPTDVTVTGLVGYQPGQNHYGGNEADPRIAGGSWWNPATQSQCTYDPKGGPAGTGATSCVSSQDPCQAGGWMLPVYQAAGICPKDIGPPPPPPPPTTLVAPPPPPPPTFQALSGAGHF